jgi:hypothetical protein
MWNGLVPTLSLKGIHKMGVPNFSMWRLHAESSAMFSDGFFGLGDSTPSKGMNAKEL